MCKQKAFQANGDRENGAKRKRKAEWKTQRPPIPFPSPRVHDAVFIDANLAASSSSSASSSAMG
mgnify:CR=1 FL=1